MSRIRRRIITIVIACVFLFSACAPVSYTIDTGMVNAVTGLSINNAGISASKLNNPFSIDPAKSWGLYIGYPGQYVHTRLYGVISRQYAAGDKFPMIDAINALPRLSEFKQAKSVEIYVDILLIAGDGKKYQYVVTPEALIVNGTGYKLSSAQFAQLASAADDAIASTPVHYARWLVYMNPYRVTQIECTDEKNKKYIIPQEKLAAAADYARSLDVSYARTYTPGSIDLAALKNSFKAVLTFESGVKYTLVLADGELYLESSDMSYACRYMSDPKQQESYGAYMKAAASGLVNNTAKS